MNQSTSKRNLVGAITGILVILVGIIAWRAWGSRTTPDSSPDKVRQFVASDQFKNLPSKDRAQWVEAAEKSLHADPEQEKMFRNLAQARMQTRLDEYFALPEGKARNDFLDKEIDKQEEVRKMLESGPSTQPGRVVIRKGGTSAAAQKDLAESVPAEYQTKIAQYIKDLKDRRAERGLPADSGPMGFMIKMTR